MASVGAEPQRRDISESGASHVMIHPIGYAVRRMIRFRGKSLKHHEDVCGSCTLLAPTDSLDALRDGLLRLQKDDFETAISILTSQWLIFDSEERFVVNTKWLICGISAPWHAWGGQGVAACLVYASTLRKYRHQRRQEFARQAQVTTGDWLIAHGFPDELAQSFHALP